MNSIIIVFLCALNNRIRSKTHLISNCRLGWLRLSKAVLTFSGHIYTSTRHKFLIMLATVENKKKSKNKIHFSVTSI